MSLQAASTSANPRVLASIDPATGEVVGTVPVTPVEEIPRLVFQAREARIEITDARG
ncbi:MAG: hypothetical protein ACKO0W_01345 [Planctomycetota bacterium]